jgi:hypothetical protein
MYDGNYLLPSNSSRQHMNIICKAMSMSMIFVLDLCPGNVIGSEEPEI